MIVEITARGKQRRVEVFPGEPGGDALQIILDSSDARVRLQPLVGSEWWRLEVDAVAIPVRLRTARTHARDAAVLVTVGAARVPLEVRRWLPVGSKRSQTAGAAHRIEVRAPMPGLVTATPLAPGESVVAGAAVAVVEAMKMQMEVPAPASGRIEDVRVRPGQEVAGGQVLVVVQASASPEAGARDR
ncbi:MAG: acetyl-CoA carboxylase biotin carboxyl carrier protein subunit [bacterium]